MRMFFFHLWNQVSKLIRGPSAAFCDLCWPWSWGQTSHSVFPIDTQASRAAVQDCAWKKQESSDGWLCLIDFLMVLLNYFRAEGSLRCFLLLINLSPFPFLPLSPSLLFSLLLGDQLELWPHGSPVFLGSPSILSVYLPLKLFHDESRSDICF